LMHSGASAVELEESTVIVAFRVHVSINASLETKPTSSGADGDYDVALLTTKDEN